MKWLAWLPAVAVCSCGCAKERQEPTAQLTVGPPRPLLDLGRPVTAGAESPAGDRLAFGTPEGTVLLAAGGGAARALGEAAVHDGAVAALRFTAGGAQLVSVGGRVAALWDAGRGRLTRQVRGPQGLTATAVDGGVAYLGTDHGAMVRWETARSTTEPLPALACPAWTVQPARADLPAAQRCPFGRYVEPSTEPGACVYPVTHLALQRGTLAVACREGALYLFDIGRRRRTGFTAGHLSALVAVEPHHLLLGRAEGQLRLLDARTRKVAGELAPPGAPQAAASSGELVAVAQPGAVRLWVGAGRAAAGSVTLPAGRRAVWLGLRTSPAVALRILAADGKLVEYPVRVRR